MGKDPLHTNCHRVKLTVIDGWLAPVLRRWMSTMWMRERAALAQIAREGNDKGDGLRGEGMKGRWTRIWTW